MKRYFQLFKQTWTEFVEDKAQRLGAALAYYTVFSIAPLLLIAVSIAGLVFGRQAVQGDIQRELAGALGPNAANALGEMIRNAAKPQSSILATIIGVILLIFGAAGVFGQLQEALDTIWNVNRPKNAGFMAMIKDRFLSMAMVFGIGFLLLVSLVIDAGISAMSGAALFQSAQIVVSFGIITVLFALMFRYLPHVRVSWRDVWFGAAFTSFLFVLGKFLLGLYIGKAAVGSAYGAAGSLVIILVWVYWSAQILFFGAEFTQVYARSHGSMQWRTAATAVRTGEAPVLHTRSGGGKMKLAVGGLAGLLIGTLLGGIAATYVAVKSVKRILMMPFR
ncbi:MAG TPA: YihY/virulence factor BrkB family protein [Thermoanaerobaculia bacterium]|jgi:membrane protein|nr:YihY/virulence factor BrkB family protein [Thermoanaerobaculia bacterium]